MFLFCLFALEGWPTPVGLALFSGHQFWIQKNFPNNRLSFQTNLGSLNLKCHNSQSSTLSILDLILEIGNGENTVGEAVGFCSGRISSPRSRSDLDTPRKSCLARSKYQELVQGSLNYLLGGGNSNIFNFHHYLGKCSNLTNIFQMG